MAGEVLEAVLPARMKVLWRGTVRVEMLEAAAAAREKTPGGIQAVAIQETATIVSAACRSRPLRSNCRRLGNSSGKLQKNKTFQHA